MRQVVAWVLALTGGVLFLAALTSPYGGITVAEFGRISHSVQEAATFFVTSITSRQIQDTYRGLATTSPATRNRVRILIVPGHQPDRGGAEFRDITERDIVVDIADELAELLRENPHFDVMVSRNRDTWHPALTTFFTAKSDEIDTYAARQKELMSRFVSEGSILLSEDPIYHVTASPWAAHQLYGINLWASNTHTEITLHLHLNDAPDRRAGQAGKYRGFTVYVPEHQYSNAEASRAVGEAIARRLNAYHATSTMPKEAVGVVEDQELIAVGSNNSADNAALLIEYGYLYEPQFLTDDTRASAVRDYAYATYLGLQDFFNDPVSNPFGTPVFPYDWSTVEVQAGEKGVGIYALQSALHYLGFYPVSPDTLASCPVTGSVGPCTLSALKAYQRARGLAPTGSLGPGTRARLNTDTSVPSPVI